MNHAVTYVFTLAFRFHDLWFSGDLFPDGYAPFMTMASRESYWNPSDDTIAAPGPGQYDPELPQDYIKVAYSFVVVIII